MAVKHLVENVRDIALVGHRAAGKTSLADALLFEAHAVDRMGSVDDGTSVADTDEEEHKHHFSIDTHVLHADHDGKHLNILDAPGYPDFIGAALEALSAVETAVVVVSAVERHRGEHAQDVQRGHQQGAVAGDRHQQDRRREGRSSGARREHSGVVRQELRAVQRPGRGRTELQEGDLPPRPADGRARDLPGGRRLGCERNSSTPSSSAMRRSPRST